ncbi:MAG: DUF4153 domain-containing protein [Chitinophagaceae bacterium]
MSKLIYESISAISLYFAFDVFAEVQQAKRSKRLGLYLLGFCILGMHYYSIKPSVFNIDEIFLSRYLIFFVAYHLLIACVAFYKTSDLKSFWNYNYYLFSNFILYLLLCLALYIGLGGALLAIDKLFKVHITSTYYSDLAAFIFIWVFTILYLIDIPSSFEKFKEPFLYKKTTRVFIQYILLPIEIVYLCILYFYLIQIVITNKIPSGWMCVPVLIAAILGILAYLLAYPLKSENNYKPIRFFTSKFFYVLLPLLALYIIAIYKRIKAYGITEDRYIIVLLGVWLVAISIYFIISKMDNIIIIPTSLFILLFVGAIGPWGMFQLSAQNQIMRLERLLKRNHLLINKQLINEDKKHPINKEDAQSISSIIDFLNNRGSINNITHWLNDSQKNIFERAIKNDEIYKVKSIFSSLNLSEIMPKQVTILQDKELLKEQKINTEPYKSISFFSTNNQSESLNKTMLGPEEIIILAAQDTLFVISIDSVLKQLNAACLQNNTEQKEYRDKNEQTFQLDNPNQEEIYKLNYESCLFKSTATNMLIQELQYTKNKDSSITIEQLQGFLLENR